MSTLVCDCDSAGISNTGIASCIPKFGVTKKLIFMPIYKDDGTKNYLDRTVTMDAAYINGLINGNRDEALYPIGGDIKNISKPKTESTKQTFDDGSIYPITAGVYGFSGTYPECGPVFAAILNSVHCTEIGVLEVNGSGSVRGYNNGENGDFIYPTPLSKATIEAIWNDASDTILENTVLNFQFAATFQPEYLEIIPSTEFSGINMLNINGLIDVTSTNVSCSTTVLVVKLRTKYNTPVKGLVITDFYDVAGGTASKVYNVTDSAALALTSVVESPSGTYTLTMTVAQTVADKIRVTPVKTGFDYTAVIANTATVA